MRAPDQDLRDRIVSARGVNLAVEAGAGTGKTTLLVERVLSLVRDGTPLCRLAIITFTRKAAAELESRLVRALSASRSEGAAWAARALEDLPRTDLGTTDSFCRTILADFALEAGVPPGFALAAELAEGALRDAAWHRFLARATETDTRRLESLRAQGAGADAIRRIADAILDGRDLPVARGGSGPLPDLRDVFARALEPAVALAPRCIDPGDLLLTRVRDLDADLRIARSLDAEAGERLLLARPRTDRRIAAKQGKQAAWGGAAIKAQVVAALETLEADVLSWMRERGTARAGALSDWLAGYTTEYARLKRERGLVDFRDLALAVRDLLREDASARRRLAARWDAILLDEAQDTDPLQMEIALLLCAEEPVPADPFDVALRPGSLFLVGDPKQSIYRFRRADLELYARAREAVRRAGESPAIQANFRCRAPVVAFVNRVFDGWMAPREGETFQAPWVGLLAGRETGGTPDPKVALLLPDPAVQAALAARHAGRRGGAEDRVELEADAVVRAVRRALGADDAGPGWEVTGADGAMRPARPGDIAIIVRRMTGGERLLDGLRRAGVPVTSVGGRTFHAREEVRTLLAVLEAIVRPDDPLALFSALRSPAFAVPDDDLVLRFLDPSRDPRETGVSPAALDAERRLLELSARVRDAGLPEAIEIVAEEVALLPVFGLRTDGPARLESLRLVLEAAAPLEAAGMDSLPEFVEWLRGRSVDEPLALGEIEPSSDDAVSLLTIHKAKGLEFPVVLLADLGGRPASADPVVCDRRGGMLEFRVPGLPDVATPGFEEAASGETQRRAAEDLRLLYVAMTRARDRLVLAWTGGQEGFFARSMLPARLGCAAGEPPPPGSDLDLLCAGDLPALPAGGRVHVIDPRACAPRRPVPADLFASAPSLPEPGRPRAVTEIVGSAAPVHGAPFPGTGSGEDPEVARRFGTFVHAALEVFHPARPEAAARAHAAAVRRAGAPPPGHEAEWTATLARVLSDPAVLALTGDAPDHRRWREVPFTARVADAWVSGRLDLLEETPAGDLRVVDWKTDRLQGAPAGDAATRHRPQAALYARAVRELTGRPVRDVRFVLLDADPAQVVTVPVDEGLEALAERTLADAGEGAPAPRG